MTTTEGNTNRPLRKAQITPQRRGAGIILAVFSIVFLLGTTAAQRAQAQTFILLHNFSGGANDGANPYAGLVRDSDGDLYGTTFLGGSKNFGTVFKLDTSGMLTVLHNMSGGSDGAYPYADLVRGSDGNLYGTTFGGGTGNAGTVFRLDTSGVLTVVYNFSGSDGANPFAGLVSDSDGNLYGTTEYGGSSGFGTVFKLTASSGYRSEIVLHSFTGYNTANPSISDGAYPFAGLVRDRDGNLYGTTTWGGSSDLGTVFKLGSSGGGFAVVHNFSGGANDGANPYGDPVRDSDGNLYGTTFNGGSLNDGTVFKLDTSSMLTVVHNFSGSDGAKPQAGLMRNSDGNLYGTTNGGGANDDGTVFKLDTSGILTVLHNFSGSDGGHPWATLVGDSDGNLYGTTEIGGSSNFGTAFLLSTTPQGAIAVIITQVNGLRAQGVINKGQDNSLLKTLQQAINMINAGKISGAIANLEMFISEVNDLENSGVLTGDQASALTSAATSVIEQLQAM